jgi:hypothetical protein
VQCGAGLDNRGGSRLECPIRVLSGELERAASLLASAVCVAVGGERPGPAEVRHGSPE